MLDSSGNVSNAACTCPAGSGLGGFGNCNHVGGILFALEDFNRKGLHQSKEPVSCTSNLSAWNVPSSILWEREGVQVTWGSIVIMKGIRTAKRCTLTSS